jgi:hypothetical protein
MMDLPEELWIEISRYLSLYNWVNLYKVCKTFAYMAKYRYISGDCNNVYSYNIFGVYDGWQYHNRDCGAYGCVHYRRNHIIATHFIFIAEDSASMVLINNTLHRSVCCYERQRLPQLRAIELYDPKCLINMPYLESCNVSYRSIDFVQLGKCMSCNKCNICNLVECLFYATDDNYECMSSYCQTHHMFFGCGSWYHDITYDWETILADTFMYNKSLYKLLANVTIIE